MTDESLRTVFRATDELCRQIIEKIDIEVLARHNVGYLNYASDPFRIIADERSRHVSGELHEVICSACSEHGIEVYDLDILNDDFCSLGSNDAVPLMAVVEHLLGSPQRPYEEDPFHSKTRRTSHL